MEMLSECGADLEGRMNEQTATTGLTLKYIGDATSKTSNSTPPPSLRVQASVQLLPGT